MVIEYIGNDKGSSLAQKILESNYSYLPDIIYIKDMADLHSFGKVCPKLKAIISHYKIVIKEENV